MARSFALALEPFHIDADRSASDWPRLSQARNEARSLFLLVETGSDTADHVRELIRVPASVKRTLTAYVARYPKERFAIERTLHFREQVLLKFERLLRPNQRDHRQVDSPQNSPSRPNATAFSRRHYAGQSA